MPLIPFTSNSIEIEITDIVLKDTVIKQKAIFTGLYHTQTNGECRVSIFTSITMYASDNGAYGDVLTGSGFQSFTVELVADNHTVVNALDGSILAIRKLEDDAQWLSLADSFDVPTMLQGDYFETVRNTQSINISDLIKYHILQADAMGKFSK